MFAVLNFILILLLLAVIALLKLVRYGIDRFKAEGSPKGLASASGQRAEARCTSVN